MHAFLMVRIIMTPKDKKQLKALAHKLKPIVLIGNNGVSEAVMREVDRALNDHQLIKIRIQGADRVGRLEALNDVCAQASAELVQVIGNIGVLYRKNPD